MRAYPTYLLIRAVASFAAASAFTLNLVYQLQDVGLGPLELVLVGTVLEVTYFAAQVPTGVVADLYGRKPSIVVGYLLTAAAFLVTGLVPTYGAVLASSVLWGVGATFVDGAEEAWVADEIGEERTGDAFLRGSQVGQVAAVLGIGTSVVLGGMRLSLPIVAGGAAWLLLTVVLAVAMPERNFQPSRPGPRSSFAAMWTQTAAGVGVVRRRRVLLLLIGAALFAGLGSEGLDRLSQAHLLTSFSFLTQDNQALWFGGLAIAGTLVSIALTEVVRRRVDMLDPARFGTVVVALQAGMVAAVLAFALAGRFWLAAGASLLIGLLRGIYHPLFATWTVANTEPETRATVLSLSGQADAAGQIAGGPPVGVVGERAGIRAALVAACLLLAPAIGCLAAALGRQARRDPATAEPAPPAAAGG